LCTFDFVLLAAEHSTFHDAKEATILRVEYRLAETPEFQAKKEVMISRQLKLEDAVKSCQSRMKLSQLSLMAVGATVVALTSVVAGTCFLRGRMPILMAPGPTADDMSMFLPHATLEAGELKLTSAGVTMWKQEDTMHRGAVGVDSSSFSHEAEILELGADFYPKTQPQSHIEFPTTDAAATDVERIELTSSEHTAEGDADKTQPSEGHASTEQALLDVAPSDVPSCTYGIGDDRDDSCTEHRSGGDEHSTTTSETVAVHLRDEKEGGGSQKAFCTAESSYELPALDLSDDEASRSAEEEASVKGEPDPRSSHNRFSTAIGAMCLPSAAASTPVTRFLGRYCAPGVSAVLRFLLDPPACLRPVLKLSGAVFLAVLVSIVAVSCWPITVAEQPTEEDELAETVAANGAHHDEIESTSDASMAGEHPDVHIGSTVLGSSSSPSPGGRQISPPQLLQAHTGQFLVAEKVEDMVDSSVSSAAEIADKAKTSRVDSTSVDTAIMSNSSERAVPFFDDVCTHRISCLFGAVDQCWDFPCIVDSVPAWAPPGF
jgi:hypothetical protein